MSKEMINSRLKMKKLNYIIEDGITYIVTEDELINKKEDKQAINNTPSIPQKKQRTTVATILSLYQKENLQLKEKIVQLENKIDKLIDDKEQMLRTERDKIEAIYSKKDEQLKSVLELISTKLMQEQKTQTIHEVESFQKEEIQINREETSLTELREYLKTLDINSKQKKIIKKRFLNTYDNDIRIITQNGKLYLDFSKYDYSDLLNHKSRI